MKQVFILFRVMMLTGLALVIVACTQTTAIPPPVNHGFPTVSTTRMPAATPTPMPTPTPAPTSPAPITPFPTEFQQEVAVLVAHDRLLYQGNTTQLAVALTFDDGPNPYYTPQILAILQQYGIKATFFCLGSLVTRYPDLVQREYAAGHIVGNHSWSHPQLTSLSSANILAQLSTTSNAIQEVIRMRPMFFRPPYGDYNSKVLTQANSLGLTIVMWNVDPRDWSQQGSNAIISQVLSRVDGGSIILMHDGGGNRAQTVEALPTIIESLLHRGFKFVTLQQMVDDLHRKIAK